METPNTMYLELDFETEAGAWFPFQTSSVNDDFEPIFDPPQSDIETGPALCVRQADGEFFDKLHKRTRKKSAVFEHNKKTRQLERIPTFDPINDAAEKDERESLWDYCIVDFKNFKDKATGEMLEMNKANKIKLMKNQMFSRFFNKCLKELASSSATVLKAETENL